MKIQRIDINNFRSYYKHSTFNLENGLNIIIGSNGDGKSTFFDALDWLFKTDLIQKDESFISKKRSQELVIEESDEVWVSVTYDHENTTKTLEKRFRFSKALDGSITTSNYSYHLIISNGIERDIRDGREFEYDLPAELRKYSMFKGETDLDIFQSTNALKQLIDTFSDVKDFEAYFSFMKFATEKSSAALTHATKSDSKNRHETDRLTSLIDLHRKKLGEIESELKNLNAEKDNYEKLIKDVENSKAASESLNAINRRLEGLSAKRERVARMIDEDYTISLLDRMWILMGFEPTARAYSDLVSRFDRESRKQEKEYIAKTSNEKLLNRIKSDFTPLPVHVPGKQIMQEMLDEEVCKICGRPAPKESEAWKFMKQKLEDYEASLCNKEDDDIPPLFANNYIKELQKRETILNDSLDSVTQIRQKVLDTLQFNKKRHEELNQINDSIARDEEAKKQILAQSDGLTEDQLTSNFTNISNWYRTKDSVTDRIKDLDRQKEEKKKELDQEKDALSKITSTSSARIFNLIDRAINNISNSFTSAKEKNKAKLLSEIEDESNSYLELLNSNDFKGQIRIFEKPNGTAEAVLVDTDGSRIFNPNTALRTTMCMAVLFAIAKLSGLRKEKEYPLIFDAPTSSFTNAKECEFFNVIGSLNKQIIIVTKSFLKDLGDGKSTLDLSQIDNIKGRVFRIEKKKPFDDKNLSTIQTVVSKIK